MTDPQQRPSLDDLLVGGDPLKTLEIKAGEKLFTISYRTMSWLDKSSCVARATELFVNDKDEPQTMFHIDVYFLEALKMMLVDFPAPVSDKILRGLRSEIGVQLQKIIPHPLSEEDSNLDKGSEKPSKVKPRKTQ